MISVLAFLTALVYSLQQRADMNYFFLENITFEFFWTIFPLVIVISLLIPSLKNLYRLEGIYNDFHLCALKVVAHQWYWRFEYLGDAIGRSNHRTDSFLISTADQNFSWLRLLRTDTKIVLPCGFPLQLSVTSRDVIHSWALPALGVKVDGVPGRINYCEVFFMSGGIYYGQCSELCGISHSIIPICVCVVDLENFLKYLKGTFLVA